MRREVSVAGALFLVILEIMKNLSPKRVWWKMEREDYAFLR
jgi:hypothetical protein